MKKRYWIAILCAMLALMLTIAATSADSVTLCFMAALGFKTFLFDTADVQFNGTSPYVIANGSAQTPWFTVKNSADGSLIDPAFYDYEYAENTNVGTASVIVTFKGEYAGTCSGTFEICSPTEIKTQPKAVTVKSGKTVMFTVVAAGVGLKYQWQYSKNGGKTWTKLSGKTSATLSFKAAKKNNGWLYRCVVKNDIGSVNSKGVKLTVK